MIDFEPLADGHLDLLREWLAREHVHRWWRDPVEQSIDECRAAIEGREPFHVYLIALDARRIGIIHTYRVSDYPEWEEVVGPGAGVAGVDLLIGEPELIGRGHGSRILREFARRIVFADPEVDAVVATVEEPNRRSWRAFEKAGFRHVSGVVEDGLPHRLMRLDRASLRD